MASASWSFSCINSGFGNLPWIREHTSLCAAPSHQWVHLCFHRSFSHFIQARISLLECVYPCCFSTPSPPLLHTHYSPPPSIIDEALERICSSVNLITPTITTASFMVLMFIDISWIGKSCRILLLTDMQLRPTNDETQIIEFLKILSWGGRLAFVYLYIYTHEWCRYTWWKLILINLGNVGSWSDLVVCIWINCGIIF